MTLVPLVNLVHFEWVEGCRALSETVTQKIQRETGELSVRKLNFCRGENMRTRYDPVGVCLRGPQNATVVQATEMPTIYLLSKDKATLILQRKEPRRIKKELLQHFCKEISFPVFLNVF